LSKQRAQASSLIDSLEPTMPTERTAIAWLQLFDESPLFENHQKLCYKKQVRRAAMQLDDVASPFAFEYLEHPEECKCPSAGTAVAVPVVAPPLHSVHSMGRSVHSPPEQEESAPALCRVRETNSTSPAVRYVYTHR